MSLRSQIKVLLLGGDGMLGGCFPNKYENIRVIKAYRKNRAAIVNAGILFDEKSIFEFDPFIQSNFEDLLLIIRPNFVINCIGVVKQKSDFSEDHFIKYNAILPWFLSGICRRYDIRLINFSTDCVFSGAEGNYTENSVADAIDIYGRTKKLGEVIGDNTLNLRTSFFGLESSNKFGLIEWFLSQNGMVKGFSNAIYSGIYNKLFVLDVFKLIQKHPNLSGLWHISSNPISKFDLLLGILERLNLKNIELFDDSSFLCDRSLDCQKIINTIDYEKHSWNLMLDNLCEDILKRK
jgi:dTDP-4-dehydrorhamnose reductase